MQWFKHAVKLFLELLKEEEWNWDPILRRKFCGNIRNKEVHGITSQNFHTFLLYTSQVIRKVSIEQKRGTKFVKIMMPKSIIAFQVTKDKNVKASLPHQHGILLLKFELVTLLMRKSWFQKSRPFLQNAWANAENLGKTELAGGIYLASQPEDVLEELVTIPYVGLKQKVPSLHFCLALLVITSNFVVICLI